MRLLTMTALLFAINVSTDAFAQILQNPVIPTPQPNLSVNFIEGQGGNIESVEVKGWFVNYPTCDINQSLDIPRGSTNYPLNCNGSLRIAREWRKQKNRTCITLTLISLTMGYVRVGNNYKDQRPVETNSNYELKPIRGPVVAGEFCS